MLRPLARRALAPLGASGLVLCLVWSLLGFLPLLGGPGYESALVAGLLLPPFVAVAPARRVLVGRLAPREALGAGASRGLGLGGGLLAISLAHGLRTRFCSVGDGVSLFLLGPLCGAVLAGLWGAVAGVAARLVADRAASAAPAAPPAAPPDADALGGGPAPASPAPRWIRLAAWATKTPRRSAILAGALALSGPLASALVSLFRFYASPLVFAFDPFVGFFSGTLYDTVIDGTDRLLTYRLGSALSALFAAGAALHLDPPRENRAAQGAVHPGLRARGWTSVLTLAALAGSLAVTALGSHLGHWQTTSTIRAQLGAERVGERCTIVYPSTLRDDEAELFSRDCDQQLGAVAAYLGVEHPPRVTAFVFQDAGQKRRLMGAADTYVAKPWRREVYVQVAGYPHPVLGHELAHVIAGELAPGPMHVAGLLGGLLPNPGLIEGIAVAASPDDDELSPEAWSRAMIELGILPPLRTIFSLDFLSQNAGRAYTVAGAFVGWVHRTQGISTVQRWYGGEALPAITGRSWADLERGFRADVAALSIPPEAMALARARFDRPALFGRVCPHEVDALTREARGLLGAGDVRGAARRAHQALSLDRHDAGALLLGATCAERAGTPALAASQLEQIAGDAALSRTARDRAEERLGDLALWRASVADESGAADHGDVAEAARRYLGVQARVLDEDRLRSLDVKLLAAGSAEARRAIVPYLTGEPSRGTDVIGGAAELGRWAEARAGEGLPLYLLGRSALSRGLPARAGVLLEEALRRGNMPPRVAREAARQLVIAGCERRDAGEIQRGLASWAAAGAPPGNRDALLRALASRCL
jgi:hypothetical protein